MKTKAKALLSACACAATLSCIAGFGVANVRVRQAMDSRQVRISYDLGDVPAIITVDVKTNGTSIGAANITHLSGDVNRLVAKTGERCVAYWQADKSWPGHLITDGSLTIDVVAWATNRPPDYCTVNLRNGDVCYYTAADQLPGGVTNEMYKSDYLAMRLISAAGVQWYMGSTDELGRQDDRETCQRITLTNDYYIGVYEFTQAQWKKFFALPEGRYDRGDLRPVSYIRFGCLRESSDGSQNPNYDWPASPNPASLMGQLRRLSDGQLAFDLPSEAQWEYACRAGTTEGRWNDGSEILSARGADANLNRLARYAPTRRDGGFPGGSRSEATTTAVGSFKPNLWGLYDMHGNVREMCLDWYKPAYRYPDDTGAVQTDKSYIPPGLSALSHALRGGQAHTANCNLLRSAARSYIYLKNADGANKQDGFRVVATLP